MALICEGKKNPLQSSATVSKPHTICYFVHNDPWQPEKYDALAAASMRHHVTLLSLKIVLSQTVTNSPWRLGYVIMISWHRHGDISLTIWIDCILDPNLEALELIWDNNKKIQCLQVCFSQTRKFKFAARAIMLTCTGISRLCLQETKNGPCVFCFDVLSHHLDQKTKWLCKLVESNRVTCTRRNWKMVDLLTRENNMSKL